MENRSYSILTTLETYTTTITRNSYINCTNNKVVQFGDTTYFIEYNLK